MSGEAWDLNGKNVLITGGASGVGLECARLFIAAGANVLIVGRKSDKLVKAQTELGAEKCWIFACDVTQSQSVNDAVAYARRSMGGPVVILVNNAGTILRKDATETSDEEWQSVFDVNVNGVFYFSRAVAGQMPGAGAIVNISSTCGQVGAAGLAAYCASKGAVDQLTRTMALELAARQITVNAVAPGAINSPMLFSQHNSQDAADGVIERNIASIPIGAIAEPKEVARAVLFLATERHITGTVLSVDGGYVAG